MRLRRRLATVVVAVAVVVGSASCDDGRADPAVGGPGASPFGAVARPVAPVVPPEGHPLSTIDRDAGVAAELRDGSLLWLFGDTAARLDDGVIDYFVIGSASWASASAPTTTHDAVDPATGDPVPFAVPTADFPPCPRPDQRQGMWPASAVVEPVGDRDRVVVWLENICLGSDRTLVDRGMSVAEWWYDPADPPIDRPVQARILNQRLASERWFGSASLVDGDRIIVYRCRTATAGDAPSTGPCSAAETTFDGVADPASYREWDGSGFGSAGEGVPMELRGGDPAPAPPGGFTVHHEPQLDRYVMAYSPWPGPTDRLEFRLSRRPTGPWSPPFEVRLPGCDDRFGQQLRRCYAGGAQPAFSTEGAMGIGFYDNQRSTFPLRGAYVVTTVRLRSP